MTSRSNVHCRASRSVLFAPGNHARRVARALASAADVVVLDLEDAVPPGEKAAARAVIAAALSERRVGGAYVRVNAVDSNGWVVATQCA